MKRFLWTVLLLAVLCMPFCAQAQVIWHDPAGTVEVLSTTLDGEEWLFLPSGASLNALELETDGQLTTVDWLANASSDDDRPNVYTGEWNGAPLHVMASQSLRSLHIQSSDPENQGRLWLHDSPYHERSTTGRLRILDENGHPLYPLKIQSLRGRGNSSWKSPSGKLPYQIKLEDRVDLLQTGLNKEYNRTWVLLSNADDQAMMRNQLGLDLARELGMESTSYCEQVDLYYDGEYRGTYLLAEKIEVGEHSVDIVNFDKILKPVNKMVFAQDPKLLSHPLSTGGHVAVGENEYGSYSHTPRVYDNTDVDAGGYLFELDGVNTLSEHTWFTLPTGSYISFKNPEYAGPTMLHHVQELFFKAYEAMLNYGYHPETDESLDELIDVDSFTRSHLVHEILHNSNAYYYASTYFYIPEKDTRIYAGPVWDFDHISRSPVPNLKDDNVLSHAFYRTTAFQQASKEIWSNEIQPMLETILFGEKDGVHLKSLNTYSRELSASWQMNHYLYYGAAQGYENAHLRFEDRMAELADFLQVQTDFLRDEISCWGGDEPTKVVDIRFELSCGDPQNPVTCKIVDDQYGSVILDTEIICTEPATIDEWGTWQVTFRIRPKPHCVIPEDVVVLINGSEYPAVIEDNAITLTYEYVDWYYRPAIADGVDYGTVFDYDYYIEMYPELEEEDLSREDVIRYFRDESMPLGECANDYFDPVEVFTSSYIACETLGEDWEAYYETYLANPHCWAEDMVFVYEPELEEVGEE